jgi:uncharacterized SAM-binding protein YcdF (DUF218 family)
MALSGHHAWGDSMRSLASYGFLAPPALFITLCLVGAVTALVWWRIGIAIVLVSTLCLYVAATPAFSSYVAYQLETEIPENVDFSDAGAIVVLGADVRSGGGRDSDRIGPASLERLVLAVDAYRRLHLPILVSGGRIADWHVAVAQLMKSVLEEYFGIPVTWSEQESRTTYENALYTAQLLRDEQINTVVVIAQREDLPRAIWSFKRVGMRAIPWPTPRRPFKLDSVEDFVPDSKALQESFHALHEMIGSLYYRAIY